MTDSNAFEVEMTRQIVDAMQARDHDQAGRLVDRLLAESTDPVATEARIQQALRSLA
ncbi:DNA-binding FadR family transcriptional regulator [Kitasatospora sp. MAA19]|uniref:hypothetical protein n=1 Tax=Kitasatospora sp. MAA19 TaxID=3035090 RepID=UPI002472F9BE|nr:hypothetical protein [Kitasatospora sp. MAA19]MDH6709763.1 DNA-binding FadR family transcriptional regulator [Kitasatospora sp. MAA19]